MRSSLRHIVLFLAVAVFGSMVSGLTAYLHLAHVHRASDHDADHCPICHVLFTGAVTYCVAPPAIPLIHEASPEPIAQTKDVIVCQQSPATVAPRPPPTSTI